MNCLNPQPVWIDRNRRSKNGGILLHFHPPKSIPLTSLSSTGDGFYLKSDFVVPCGKCLLCKHERFKSWVNRLRLEAFDNPSSFLTLTYDNQHLEDCNKPRVQRFLKKFRQLVRKGLNLQNFKYFFVSEYGHTTHRPHYHAILFGVDLLRDPFFKAYVATSKRDNHGKIYPVYSSPVIEKLWDCGFISVDRCTPQNIRYVAKYVAKQFNEDSNLFYLYSRRIGTRLFVGKSSLLPFGRSSFTSGKILIDRDSPPSRAPRFLDYYARKFDDSLYKAVKASRRAFAKCFKQDSDLLSGRASDILFKKQTAKRNEIL